MKTWKREQIWGGSVEPTITYVWDTEEGEGTAEEIVSQYMVQPNLKHLIYKEFQFLTSCGFNSWGWQSDL